MTTVKQGSSSLFTSITESFSQHYLSLPTCVGRAPGRVNIIGEHTDYNEGFVLPAAMDRNIFIAGKLRDDDIINLWSLDYNAIASFTLDKLQDKDLPAWSSYLRGVLWVLQSKGHTLQGMDIASLGNVPLAGGFSSSAAAEVAMFELICGLLGIEMTQTQKALLGVEVENRFIGVPSGAMDQLISALGQADHAILIDCRSLATTPIRLPHGVTLLALDTGKRRALLNSEYGVRRKQCEEAARLLGVKALRDVTPEQLAARAHKLPELIERRAAHVVNENARTLAAVDALKSGDLAKVGKLMDESHVRLRDLYEVSITELDVMAALVQSEKGCYGARMMGGGFGGAVIALVDDGAVERITATVGEAYDAATHLKAFIYPVKAGAGSGVELVK